MTASHNYDYTMLAVVLLCEKNDVTRKCERETAHANAQMTKNGQKYTGCKVNGLI